MQRGTATQREMAARRIRAVRRLLKQRACGFADQYYVSAYKRDRNLKLVKKSTWNSLRRAIERCWRKK